MVEKLETDWRRRLDAGVEAIELLDRAGFNVHGFSIDEEAAEAAFGIEAELSVGELTRPLEALEDEPDADLGSGFVLGLTAGLLAGSSDDCACGSPR